MKKILLSLILCVLVSSVVLAARTGADEQHEVTDQPGGQPEDSGQPEVTGQPQDSGNPEGTIGVQQQTQNQGEDTQIEVQQQTQVKSGVLTVQGGKQVQVQVQSNEQTKLRSGSIEARTSMQMTQQQTENGTKLQVKLSNGMNAEIKVMPDVASERALERLRLKTCSAENNCTIELKEVKQGDQVKAAYEVQVKKQARFLGLFKIRMQVQAQVDAENGEVIRTRKPWWAFLASDSEE